MLLLQLKMKELETQTPHPVVFTVASTPFHCTNPNRIWFAVPYGTKGQYLIRVDLTGRRQQLLGQYGRHDRGQVAFERMNWKFRH